MHRARKNRSIIIGSLLILLLMISVGYAAFQTSLTIRGTSRITSNWDVRITNVTTGVATGDAENVSTPTWTDLTAYMEANLYDKGSAMDYDVTISNRGTFDAKLDNIITTPSSNEAVIITFSGYTKGETLAKGQDKVIHVKIQYNPNYNGTAEVSGTSIVEFQYVQDEGSNIPTETRYLLTYDYGENGGTSTNAENEYLAEGTVVNLSGKAATKAGYTFVGWNTDKNAHTALSTTTMTANTTLYAIFSKQLTITFDKNGNTSQTNASGTAVTTQTVTRTCTLWNKDASCSVTAPTMVAASGFTIDGYSTGATTYSDYWTHNTAKNVSADATWYAQSTKAGVDRTITFYRNGNTNFIHGGTTTTGTSRAITVCTTPAVHNGATQAGSCSANFTMPTITAPNATPTVLGWSEGASNRTIVYTSGQVVNNLEMTSNRSLYAQTQKAPLDRTITFYKNGNTSFTYGGTTYTDNSKTFTVCTIAASYNGSSQGGSCTANVTMPTITAPDATPDVIGWSTGANTRTATYTSGQVVSNLSMTADKSFYAQSQKAAIPLTASWNANGASLSSTTASSCNIAAAYNGATQGGSCTVDAPTITRSNYDIIGFNTTAASTSNNSSYNSSTGKLTLTASNTGNTWYAVTKKTAAFTASWNANGATLSSTTAKSCYIYNTAESCTVDAPTITRSNYDIIGFNTSASSTSNNSSYNTSTGKLTLSSSNTGSTWYAITKKTAAFTASWNANGATLSSTAAKSCNIYNTSDSCTVDAPTITRTDYDIIGFNTSASSTANNSSYNTSTKKLTLTSSNTGSTWYAVTKKTSAFTAIWNANGATLSSTTAKSCNIYNTDNSCTVDAPTITRDGFTITGFNTTAASTANNSSYNTSTGKLTLSSSNTGNTWYAITSKLVTLTFHKNGNTSQTNASGTAVTDETVTRTCTIQNSAVQCSITAPTMVAADGFTINGYSTGATTYSNYWTHNTAKTNISADADWYAQSTKAAVNRTIKFYRNSNTNFIHGGTTTTGTSRTITVCTIPATHNGTAQDTSCSADFTMPTITAPSATPTVIGWSTGSSTRTASYTSGQVVTGLTMTANRNLYAQSKSDAIDRTITFYRNGNTNFIHGGTTTTGTSRTITVCTIASTYNGTAQGTSCSANFTMPTITAPSATPDVIGWSDAADNRTASYTSGQVVNSLSMSSNRSLYAQSQKASVQLTASWNANGASLSSTSASNCTIAAAYNGASQGDSCTVDAPTITRSNYDIIGFNTSASSTANNSSYNTSTKKLTLTSSNTGSTWYAVTKKIAAYTATWNSNGATLSSTTSKSCYIYNTETTCTVDAPTITRNGYTIIGYNTSASSTTNNSNYNTSTGKLTLSASGTWYAITKSDTACTANWVPNGATLSFITESSCYLYNTETTCTIDAPTITRDDFTITGFNTSASSTTNNSSYSTSTGKLTCNPNTNSGQPWYAITKKMFTITYAKGTGVSSISPTTTSVSKTIQNSATSVAVTLPKINPSTNYGSLGWFDGDTKVGDSEGTYYATGAIALTAKAKVLPVLKSSTGSSTNVIIGSSGIDKTNVTSIVFEDSINIPNGATNWDVSAVTDSGAVMAWATADPNDNTKYVIHVGGDGGVIANTGLGYLFDGYTNLASVTFGNNFDTTRTTGMSYMFRNCTSLTSLDLSSFDTSKVTNMSYMFSGCTSLTSLNLSTFDTSKVTNMGYMFAGNTGLTSITFGTGWSHPTATSNNMQYMFRNCSSLTTLNNLNYLNTSNVTNMTYMFYNCPSLTNLNVSNFDTSKVTNMSYMFAGNTGLTSITFGEGWSHPTAASNNMKAMFQDCSSLITLTNLNYLDTSNVTNMGDDYSYSGMFNGCSSLTSLDVSTFDTSNVTSMRWMFQNCSNLTSITFGTGWSHPTAASNGMGSMFAGCTSLTTLNNLNNVDTSNVTSMANMFQNCTSLTNLNLSNFDTSNVSYMSQMFDGCSGLTGITFGTGWGHATATSLSMQYMFRNCTSLTSLDLSTFDTSNVTSMNNMFQNCTSLTNLNVSNFDTSNVTTMTNMFYNCSALTTLKLCTFDTLAATAMNYMFQNTTNMQAIYVGSGWDTSGAQAVNMFTGSGVSSVTQLASCKLEAGISVAHTATPGTITLTVSDSQNNNITSYEYSIDGGTTWVTQTNPNIDDNIYTFTGLTYNTQYTVKVRVTDNNNNQVIRTLGITTENVSAPTFSENVSGEVIITYPSGCSSPYSCKYQIDGGQEITVTGNETLPFATDGIVDAKVTIEGNTITSTYNLKKVDLYVSSSGNDTTGYGTQAKPYATIGKAYDSASSSRAATIHLLTNIDVVNNITMNSSKSITIDGGKVIKRANSNVTPVIAIASGSLTLNGTKLDGNLSNYLTLTDGPLLSVTNGASSTINSNSSLELNSARGLYVNNGSSVTLNGKIEQCLSRTGINGGAIYIGTNSTVTQNVGSQITESGTNSGNGGGVYIASTGTFNTSGIIYENSAANGGGIYNNGGTVNINEGSNISYNGASAGSGGGIYSNGGTVTLNGTTNGGIIQNNTTAGSDTGGGGINMHGGTLTVNKGTITENTTVAYGGGIDSTAAANININGGTISNNTVSTGMGGGVHLGTNVTGTMTNGTITANHANGTESSTGNGGGMSIQTTANMTISGGTISNNVANRYYGGIALLGNTTNSGELTISGGTISGNTATNYDGGGIGVEGDLTMTGGSLTSNTGRYGGAIYINNNGTFNLRGGSITNNVSRTAYNGVNYGAIYKTSGATYNVNTSGSQYCNNNGQSNINTQCIFNTTTTITITSSKTTQDTQTCTHNNASFGGYGYRYRFNITVTNGSVTSGKMCYSPDSSSTTSYCATYRNSGLASGNAGYACFVGTNTWDFYRANYCVYAVVNGSNNSTKTKYQC